MNRTGGLVVTLLVGLLPLSGCIGEEHLPLSVELREWTARDPRNVSVLISFTNTGDVPLEKLVGSAHFEVAHPELTETIWTEVTPAHAGFNDTTMIMPGDSKLVRFEGVVPVRSLGRLQNLTPDHYFGFAVKLTAQNHEYRQALTFASPCFTQAGEEVGWRRCETMWWWPHGPLCTLTEDIQRCNR